MIDPRIVAFKKCYTSITHDVMRVMRLHNFTLPLRIMPLQPEMTLCGSAYTIEGGLEDGW